MAILPTLILGPSLILKTISSEEGGICRTSGWTVANCRPRSDRYSLIDRKSTRLNSSHRCISYAVFCLQKLIGGLLGAENVQHVQTIGIGQLEVQHDQMVFLSFGFKNSFRALSRDQDVKP